MRISNTSTSVVLRGCALRTNKKAMLEVVYLEMTPQHPKQQEAIWATLVNNTVDTLSLRDGEQFYTVTGMHRKYHKATAEAPSLSGRARPKLLRLVAPEALGIEKTNQDFIAFEWPGRTLGQTLAAMLERGSAYPIRIGWGDYLLSEVRHRTVDEGKASAAEQLVVLGAAPEGIAISGKTDWLSIIKDGLASHQISLE
jgi:hypothetical protein